MGKKTKTDSNLARKGLTRVKRDELKKLVDELLQSESYFLQESVDVNKFLTLFRLLCRMLLLSIVAN